MVILKLMDIKVISLTIHFYIACINGQSYMYDVYEGAVIPAVTHWGYNDNNGPEEWPELFPNKCAGKYQSPVDIRPRKTKFKQNLSKFIFYDSPFWGAKYFAHNNGHTIQVNTWGLHMLANGGLNHTYRIAQFHFHWGDENDQGAEHTVNERAAPMEMHIVSWNHEKYTSIKDAAKAPDGLAVLGILFKISRHDNQIFEPLIQAIPKIRDPDWNNQVEIAVIPVRKYLPQSPEKYYRYRGSLTTPRCYESVTWTVFNEKQNISRRQLNVFRQALTSAHSNEETNEIGKYYSNFFSYYGYWNGYEPEEEKEREPLVNNYRPVLPLNGRTIYRSFKF